MSGPSTQGMLDEHPARWSAFQHFTSSRSLDLIVLFSTHSSHSKHRQRLDCGINGPQARRLLRRIGLSRRRCQTQPLGARRPTRQVAPQPQPPPPPPPRHIIPSTGLTRHVSAVKRQQPGLIDWLPARQAQKRSWHLTASSSQDPGKTRSPRKVVGHQSSTPTAIDR